MKRKLEFFYGHAFGMDTKENREKLKQDIEAWLLSHPGYTPLSVDLEYDRGRQAITAAVIFEKVS